MATKTSLRIDIKNPVTEKITQKSIASVNPNASDYELKEFAKSLVGLTTKEFAGATRIDVADISEAVGPRDPLFKITPATVAAAAFNDEPYLQTFAFEYLGADRVATFSGKRPLDETGAELKITVAAKAVTISAADLDGTVPTGTDTAVLSFTLPATEDYDAATTTLTFVAADANAFKDV